MPPIINFTTQDAQNILTTSIIRNCTLEEKHLSKIPQELSKFLFDTKPNETIFLFPKNNEYAFAQGYERVIFVDDNSPISINLNSAYIDIINHKPNSLFDLLPRYYKTDES